jgi:hypothetical protein
MLHAFIRQIKVSIYTKTTKLVKNHCSAMVLKYNVQRVKHINVKHEASFKNEE